MNNNNKNFHRWHGVHPRGGSSSSGTTQDCQVLQAGKHTHVLPHCHRNSRQMGWHGYWASPGDWQTHHSHHSGHQRKSFSVSTPVHSSAAGECGLLPQHNEHRIRSRRSHCLCLVFTPAALCWWALGKIIIIIIIITAIVTIECQHRQSHAVYQQLSFSMASSNLKPDFEVTAFLEVEYLGPGGSYVRYGTRYPTSNRPIWSISNINASRGFVSISWASVCFTVGLVKNTLCTMRTLPIAMDSHSTAKEPHVMWYLNTDFLASLSK